MTKLYVILIAAVLILQSIHLLVDTANIASNSLQQGAPWPKEGRNEYRSFQSSFDIGTTFPPTEQWRYVLATTTVYGSPIIGNDGSIYIGTTSGLFYAIHGSTGVKKYTFSCGAIYSSALIASNDLIYLTSADSYVYALDVTLMKKWSYMTDSSIYASPIIDSSYNVYVGSFGGYFYCISNGILKWKKNLNSPIQQSAVFRGSSVFIILNNNKLYQLDSSTGSKVSMQGGDPNLDGYGASTTASSFVWSVPVVDKYNNIYIGTRSASAISCPGSSSCNHIFKLSTSDYWEDLVQIPTDTFYSSGAIDYQNDLIYFVGGALDILYCYRVEIGTASFEKSYSINWDLYLLKNKARVTNTEIFIATPVITSSGLIIVSNTVGEIYVVRNDVTFGTILWNGYLLNSNSPVILNSVAIGVDGTIYVIASGVLYALGTSYASAPCSSLGQGIGTSLKSDDYSTSSIQCVDCTTGFYSDSSICEQCLLGTYSSTIHSSSCISCQLGQTTTGFGSDSSSDCVSCDEGKYSSSPSDGCSACLPGYYTISKGATSCSSCLPGYYTSTSGSTFCVPCVPGYYSSASGASECLKCVGGTYSSAGSSTCNICDKGKYSTLASATCQFCPIGAIAKYEGSSSCDLCLPGYSTASTELGASNCIQCEWPSTTLDIHGSTSCNYFKLFLRDYENIKVIFQAIVCCISSLLFVGGMIMVEERVDESILRISRIGFLVFAVVPSLELLFNVLYFTEHLFLSVYLFWALGIILILPPLALFIHHLVRVRAYPYLHTFLMPEFLRYAEPYWLRIIIENHEIRGIQRRKYTYLVNDQIVTKQQWILYLPMYLGQLMIHYIMISPWLLASLLFALIMLIIGTTLYHSKIMSIGKVHNTWFTVFTGRKLCNIRDPLHLSLFNESLFYSVLWYSIPQFALQAANADSVFVKLPVMERTSLCLNALMILWVGTRTIIHKFKKTSVVDIPINFTLGGLNFMHVDRSLILPIDALPGELPIDATELDEEGNGSFNNCDDEIISLELAEAVAVTGHVREISNNSNGVGTDPNLLGAFDFLDFWSVFTVAEIPENLPNAKPIKSSNAIKAVGVQLYNGRNI